MQALRSRQRAAQRLTALYQQIGGEWVDARVVWEEGLATTGWGRGFWALHLPAPFRSYATRRLWLGLTYPRAVTRVRAHRARALRPERIEVADRVADVMEGVALAVTSVAAAGGGPDDG